MFSGLTHLAKYWEAVPGSGEIALLTLKNSQDLLSQTNHSCLCYIQEASWEEDLEAAAAYEADVVVWAVCYPLMFFVLVQLRWMSAVH